MGKQHKRLPDKQATLVNDFYPRTKKQQKFIELIESNEITIAKGVPGTGKSQPLYSTVYTPDGPTTMGEIKIGQKVCDSNGGSVEVDGIYPQGLKDCYKIYFSDNTTVDCCGEHLWKVYTERDRKINQKKKIDQFTILQTKDMVGSILVGSDNRKNYKLPITKPVFYNKKNLVLNPYLIGVLIGDGGMTSANTVLSSKDQEIIDSINNIVQEHGLYVKPNKDTLEGHACDYLIAIKNRTGNSENFVTRQTGELGIRCKSQYKFIPKEYLYSSIEDRVALLQGLMDTDGTVDKKSGCPSFSTSSMKLRNDFCELIRSLGGVAT